MSKKVSEADVFQLFLKIEHGLAPRIDGQLYHEIARLEGGGNRDDFMYDAAQRADGSTAHFITERGKQWMQEYMKRHAKAD